MISITSKHLQELCARHGLLAAILLQQTDAVIWPGSLSQTDYAHLLFIAQTQTLPVSAARLDAVQLSNQPVLVHSQLLEDGSLALLVFPFEMRLKDVDQRATACLQEIESTNAQQKQNSLLDGLKPRQVEAFGSADDDLLALFSAMPEADPSNDATQPFRVSTIQLQTLEKSADAWKQIF